MELNKLGYKHDVASHHAPYYCRYLIPEQFSATFCHILNTCTASSRNIHRNVSLTEIPLKTI